MFNLIINTFIQFVSQEQFSQFGYSLTNLLRPTYWFQFADDAAVFNGQEYETQILLNVFSTWCTWSKMIIRVDKCHTFGIMKKNTTSTQTKPKLYVNIEIIPPLQDDESFEYLRRYFNFSLNNQKYRAELLETTTTTLNNINKLHLHPYNKLNLYSKYLLNRLSWHLIIADIPETWLKENLDSLCHKKLRSWPEIPINGTLDTVQLPKSKLGLNIIDISTKYVQCQVTIRKKRSTSKNGNIKYTYESAKYGSNIKYNNCNVKMFWLTLKTKKLIILRAI